MSERIKVNFTVTKESKKILDEANKANFPSGKSRSDIIDTLLRFDENSAELYIEIFKHINKKKSDFISLNNGGLILNKETIEQVRLLDISVSQFKEEEEPKEELEEVKTKKSSDRLTTDNEIDIEKLDKVLDTHERAILTLDLRIKELQKKLDGNFDGTK